MTQIESPLSLHYVSPGTLSQGAIFPPVGTAEAELIWVFAMNALARRLNPPRRLRSNPRVVKRKVLKWAAKRLHHHHWPQPEHPPQICVLVLN
ncbi:hypothetical protein [Ferrimicrobium acidiphilum]|uniref:hypothetical protein n=1 Tax=Ferrimicrobium acidiphilum TaxID=121039 RepID=UPI0023F3E14E|nr:hypothetical protein [Ferrimicrobium acidiphilum]